MWIGFGGKGDVKSGCCHAKVHGRGGVRQTACGWVWLKCRLRDLTQGPASKFESD